VGKADRETEVTAGGTLPAIRPIWWISLVVFIASVVIGVIYLTNDRPKHGAALIGLAAVAAVGVWMTSGPRSKSHQ
jgi:hypothetical protein